MNILLYYQNPYHTVFLESLVQGFIKKGHTVFFLTTCEEGVLHEKMKSFGAKVETNVAEGGTFTFYRAQVKFLIRFCRKHDIDIVYAHLQTANLVAAFARPFIRAEVFPCRHHADDVSMRENQNAIRQDKLVNRLSKKIVVVSNAVKQHMVKHELVDPAKIEVIPLGYNFDLYDQPDELIVKKIRGQMQCRLLLILIGRMNRNKNHIAALEVLNKLVVENYDVKMIIMDDGPEKATIQKYISDHGLSEKILFTGFMSNTMDHIAAADLLVHPSLSEASNQVVKEAALLRKPSIVCNEVGDFAEYIVNGKNGFTVSKNDIVNEMCLVIRELYQHQDRLEAAGQAIHNEVKKRFAIEPVCDAYLALSKNSK
ncbi:MAG: glycosyltransferase family 4 protein [Bacteroidia bacterium]